jgi:hypothetical protein
VDLLTKELEIADFAILDVKIVTPAENAPPVNYLTTGSLLMVLAFAKENHSKYLLQFYNASSVLMSAKLALKVLAIVHLVTQH